MESFEELYRAAEAARDACDAHWKHLKVAGGRYGQSGDIGTRPLDAQWEATYHRLNGERVAAERRLLDLFPKA